MTYRSVCKATTDGVGGHGVSSRAPPQKVIGPNNQALRVLLDRIVWVRMKLVEYVIGWVSRMHALALAT